MTDIPPERTLSGVLGIEFLEIGEESARARMPVSERCLQPFGFVHGGALIALAETVASAATASHVVKEGRLAFGQEISASLLRSVREGEIYAWARRRRAGRSTWVWEVDLTDAEGTLVAVVRCTVAVRERDR